MNECRVCGMPTDPPHNICPDCAYDVQNEIADWGLYPLTFDL